jgi:chromosomal replication initiator protein
MMNAYAIPGIVNITVGSKQKRLLTMDQIRYVVLSYYKMTIDDLNKNTNKREIVEPRQICMYLSMEYTLESLRIIGKFFGNRDHTTVIHSHHVITNLLRFDIQFQQKFNKIEILLKLK